MSTKKLWEVLLLILCIGIALNVLITAVTPYVPWAIGLAVFFTVGSALWRHFRHW